jgi:hypothetical protein
MSILDKTAQELTVKDQLKLTAVVTAVFIGVPIAIGAVGSAVERIRARRTKSLTNPQ